MTHFKINIIRICLLAFCVGVVVLPSFAVTGDIQEEGEREGRRHQLVQKGVQPQARQRAHRVLPIHQKKALEQAEAEGVSVSWGERMQSPASVRGQDLGEQRSFSRGKGLRAKRGAPWKDNAVAVMDNLSSLYDIADAEEEFEVKRVDPDKLGFHHVRLAQRHRGLRVMGAELIVHFNAEGQAYEVNGEYAPTVDVDAKPKITAAAAILLVRNDQTAMSLEVVKVTEVPELMIYAYNGATPRLAYELFASSKGAYWRYWIDAVTGDVLLKYNDIKRIDAPDNNNGDPATISGSLLYGEGGDYVQVEGWLQNGSYYLYNTNFSWMIYNASGHTNLWTDANTYAFRATDNWDGDPDPTQMSAAYNINLTQRYFREVHGRKGYDGVENRMLRVNVHQAEGGNPMDNAYWDGATQQISIGDGYDLSGDFSLAVLDIMAHEYTHAVTDFSADLIYMNESGALNESFSDIFGTSVEFWAQMDGRQWYPNTRSGTADWLLGEDNLIPARDLRNPMRYQQPSRYKGTLWYLGAGDNGGVHYNSGPHNFFYYLLCEGGWGINDQTYLYNLAGIGIENAEQIAYRVLTVYCTPSTGYEGVRIAWYSAVRDLFPNNPEYLASVRYAWDAVMGTLPPPQIKTESPLPDGRVGNEYSLTFSAQSYLPVFKWYLIDGAFPNSLTFSSSGKLSGYCAESGSFTFSVVVEALDGQFSTTNTFDLYIRESYEEPLSENFEEMESALTGWSQQFVSGSPGWRVRHGGAVGGRPLNAFEGSMNAYLGKWNDSGTLTYSDHVTRLRSPMIKFASGSRAAQLKFSMVMESWAADPLNIKQDELRVYCKTNWFDDWGMPIATYTTAVYWWSLQVIDLPPPPPEGQAYFIAFEGTALGGYGICLDSIWIGDPTPPLAIVTPSVLPVALTETNYVNLVTLESEGGWSTDPGEYTYVIIDGAMPTGFGLTPDGVVTGCSMTVQSGTFLVQVTDSKGKTATKEMTLSVEVPRAPVFEENFDVSFNIQTWPQSTLGTSGVRWQLMERGGHTSAPLLPAHDAHSPSRFMWLYGASPSSLIAAYLMTPVLDLSQAPNNTRLNFWHIMPQKNSKHDELFVLYRVDANSGWVTLATYQEEVTNWTQRVISLPNLSSTYQIAFLGNSLGGAGVAIDSVSITDDAAAPIITTLPKLPGSFRGFPYYVALTAIGGMPPYNWSLVSGTLPTGLTLNLNGEIIGTPTVDTYASFSIAVTGADGRSSTNSFNLRILPPGSIPFEEKFDSPTIPEGWTLERIQGMTDWVISKGTISTSPSALPTSAPVNAVSNACLWAANSHITPVRARLISPPINLSSISSNAVLTFQHCMASSYGKNDRLIVRYRASLTNDWTDLAVFSTPLSKWTLQTVALPSTSSTYYIAFEGYSLGGCGVCVGDIVIMGDVAESPFEIWQKDHFDDGELSDPNISGPNADPDGDGLDNLFEYGMGLDPKVPDNNTWIYGGITNMVNYQSVPNGSYLYLKYRRAHSAAGVTFTVIGTPSLTPSPIVWSPADIRELAPWEPGADPSWSWVNSIHLTPTTNAPQRFMRLRLELD